MNRQAALTAILAALPGNDAATQCLRIQTALVAVGPLSTVETRRDLDVMMPAARVHELRHRHGLNIVTSWVGRPTDAGPIHRVAIYALHPDAKGNA